MKKAMLSQPMAGKTEQEIIETRERAVKALQEAGYEIVNTLFTDEWYSKESMEARGVVQIPLCFLAKSLEMMSKSITGDTSDGYHTFNELYHHRAVLFSVIVNASPDRAWKSLKHHDGSMYDGMFIVGIETPDGQATYHYDKEPYWDMFTCRELERAPEWDGHTPAQAIERISRLQLLKHGQWLDGGECSQCHEFDNRDPYGSNYCPNCGARMDGDEYAAD